MEDLSKMTDDEIVEELISRYGENFGLVADIDTDELFKEYIKRIGSGI